ncbi:MAG: T9SS type A sorting domain-containing protein [Haliscomenobacter sp.]|nr:T9SS type A sorting domain-containing protein [Haliscomenobacter sp.]
MFPNPFQEETRIVFEVETEQDAEFQVCDAQGRVVLIRKRRISSGVQEFFLRGEDLPGAGLYRFSIRTAEGHFTGTLGHIY